MYTEQPEGHAMNTEDHTTLDLAVDYVRRGWTPIPVPAGTKGPDTKGWQHLRFDGVDDPALEEIFSDHDGNVGIILGDASSGLIDVDLDCDEARWIVKSGVMTPTGLVSGTDYYPSHLWYLDADCLGVYEKLTDPCMDHVPADRATLIEIRGASNRQTLVAPSIHPDTGKSYTWISYGEPGRHDGEILNDYLDMAAVALLMRYWPTSRGFRNDAYMALAGALLTLNVDEGEINDHWLETLEAVIPLIAHYNSDEEANERWRTVVPSTRDAILTGRSVTGFTRLAELFDKHKQGTGKAVWSARDWLQRRSAPASEEMEEVGTLEAMLDSIPAETASEPPLKWESLREIIDNDPVEPEELIEGLIFRDQVHLFLGYGGGGKSMVCLWAMRELVTKGIRSAWIDWQNGPNEAGLRARDLGLGQIEDLDDWIKYVAFPTVAMADDANALIAQLQQAGVEVVFIDSLSDALKKQPSPSAPGVIEENSNHDVGWFFTEAIDRLRTAGITVVIIDHLAKSDPSRARGAVIKDDLAQVVWSFKVVKKFNAKKPGRLRLRSHKTRIGNVPEAVVIDITPATDDAPLQMQTEVMWEWTEDDDSRLRGHGPARRLDHAPSDFELTEPEPTVEEQVIALLREQSDEDNPLSTRALRSQVKARSQEVTDFLALAREHHELIQWVEGPRKSLLYFIPAI